LVVAGAAYKLTEMMQGCIFNGLFCTPRCFISLKTFSECFQTEYQ